MIRLLKNDIDLYGTLLSGQCFRVTMVSDTEFVIVIKDRVISVRENGKYLEVNSNNCDNLENVVKEYFDLNTDYEKINEKIIKNDALFEPVVLKCKGYKVLKQNPLEMLISYIISQNNNVKRISNSIEKFCMLYGEKVEFLNKDYYLFPSLERIIKLKIEDIEPLKIGFRDKYIIDAVKMLESDVEFLDKIKGFETSYATEELMKIKGIGLKVASCILLFGYHRFDTFPIDTWVKKYVSENYKINDDLKVIKSFMLEKFSNYSGLAIQYMFHVNRNLSLRVK